MKFAQVMMALFFAVAAPAQQLDSKAEVGDHRLHVACEGKGSPAVIFEAGMGDGIAVWNRVQQTVAKTTRACSYDRAGIGGSDSAGDLPRGPDAIISDLHLLLANARIAPPYILVGHSVGGMFMRLFASRYPQEVVGMVLVDSSHEGLGDSGAISGLLTREEIDLAGTMVAARREHWLANIPLVVLARHRTDDELPPGISAERRVAIQHRNEQEQEDLASRSPRGKLIWVDGTSHYIQRDAPGEVIEAISQVLAVARK